MAAKKILIADDQWKRLAPLAASLRNAGFNVTATDSPAEAMAVASSGTDLLVTHYTLDNSSGVELCQQLRHDARSAATPAVLVTAPGYALSTSAPAKAGIWKIVACSSRPADLVAEISEVLAHRAA